MSTTSKGRRGEEAAARYLEASGFEIIARNYRSPEGEVDIVAQDHGVLVFIEVKSWGSLDASNLEYAINEKKQQKIIKTAKFFLSNHRKYSNDPVRFDVVLLSSGEIRHLAEAFMESV